MEKQVPVYYLSEIITCMSLGRDVFKTQPKVRLFLLTKKILILSQLPLEDREEIVQSLDASKL